MKGAAMMQYRRNYELSQGDAKCLEFPLEMFQRDQWKIVETYIKNCNIDFFRFLRKEYYDPPETFIEHDLDSPNEYISKCCKCRNEKCPSAIFFMDTPICEDAS